MEDNKKIATKRTYVEDSLKPEYSPIGSVTSVWKDGQSTYSSVGTGTLVGANVVFTAASNVYSRKLSQRS